MTPKGFVFTIHQHGTLIDVYAHVGNDYDPSDTAVQEVIDYAIRKSDLIPGGEDPLITVYQLDDAFIQALKDGYPERWLQDAHPLAQYRRPV